jgi:putative Ca2+/H+ antiporter (TMEM165/GDT1 family)
MWQTALTTFAAVFVAELADKTQLATLALAAESPSRLGVFIGSATALASTSLLAVLAGGAISRVVPPAHLQRAAGALFVAMGAWMLWRSWR